jgi:hypothetical protein
MMRIMFLAVATAGLAMPALADTASFDPAKSAAFGAGLVNAATAEQARLQLAHQGYTGISDLNRDETGRWVGTAMKDGKTVIVAVVLPHTANAAASN